MDVFVRTNLVNFILQKLAKYNRKNNANKWFIKFKNIAGTISKKKKKYSFQKNIFPLILLPWSHFGRRRWRFLDFRDQSRATSGLFPNDLVEWRRMRVTVLLPFIELARRFDEALSCCEAPSPVWSYLWIFSSGFSSLEFSDFSPLLLMEDLSIYRWRWEFEFQIPQF